MDEFENAVGVMKALSGWDYQLSQATAKDNVLSHSALRRF